MTNELCDWLKGGYVTQISRNALDMTIFHIKYNVDLSFSCFHRIKSPRFSAIFHLNYTSVHKRAVLQSNTFEVL